MIKNYYIQMPEKVAEILPTWEGNPPFRGFHIDNLRVILSIISTHQKRDDNGDAYAQLKMEYLRNIVWHAEEYISFLRDVGIIERVGGFSRKEHYSWSYRFTEAYQSPYIKTELNNIKLIGKIGRANNITGWNDTRRYPEQKKQLKTMTIDYDSALEGLKWEYTNTHKTGRYNFAVGQATRIRNGEFFYFTRDDSGHRVHTPLTGLIGTLRGYIKIGGKYISGIDIGNSQLYFSIKYLLDPESIKDFFPGNLPLMRAKCLRLPEQQDVINFIYLAYTAQFYDYMATELNRGGVRVDRSTEEGRKKFKERMFTLLFEENHLTSKSKKIFQKLFPNVDKAFSLLRMMNYTDFVNSLARIESYAVNNLIIVRLEEEYPDMIAQQIYDNLVTSTDPGDIEMASRVMTEELTNFVGFPPVFKIQDFRKGIEEKKGIGEGERKEEEEGGEERDTITMAQSL